LPEELRRSLTWDQGAEMAQHARLKVEAGVEVYFCDRECRNFRVRAGIMGKKESHYVSTQRACDTERVA
jgi:hypothetical protein